MPLSSHVLLNDPAAWITPAETTGRALSATLALLAIHQDEQEKAYREITRILPDGREPVQRFMHRVRS
jgi:cytochrome P450